MVKDPLDEGRTKEIEFPEASIPLEQVPELPAEYKTTLTQEEVEAAFKAITERSFSARHPELGKMINCQVCELRHRQFERKCEQVFTYTVGDQEYWREDGNGFLVPARRTAIPVDRKPTMKQQLGAAQFVKKRWHPHPSKIKLLFIERVRKVFEALGFDLDATGEEFSKNLHRARIVAARQLRRERRLASREIRRRQDDARRKQRGLT